jgi:hypothetical protein
VLRIILLTDFRVHRGKGKKRKKKLKRGGNTKQISLQSLQSAEIESVSSFKSSPPLPTVDLLPEIMVEGELFSHGCVCVCVCVCV